PLVRRFHTLARSAGRMLLLTNLYGPTEATIDVTYYDTTGDEDNIPIGAPIANTQCYVVDTNVSPQPVGAAGELLIGGVQVADGYISRPDLTAEKFIADPFSDSPGARLYRTGDLARWRPDGKLEYLGRNDFQVKIRGMRVELGEIEAALSDCDGVAQAAVATRRGSSDDTRLVAYVVPQSLPDEAAIDSNSGEDTALRILELGESVDLEALRNSLLRTLPEHMVPTEFIGLRKLPLTPSGKADRNALPDVLATLPRAM
ncbi:MAG: amino acid adenylation domain-containing protein, partial [bacterium]|nr:amino acid adenylation domain-containing protein [bacterium]